MRTHLGFLTFLLATAFATCLVGTLILNSWYDFPNDRSVLGFFGFGIPTMLIGGATAALWDGHTSLLKLLGWTGMMVGIVCGVAVLLLVVGWVLAEGLELEYVPIIVRAAGFGVAGLVCGGFGIAMLFLAEGKTLG